MSERGHFFSISVRSPSWIHIPAAGSSSPSSQILLSTGWGLSPSAPAALAQPECLLLSLHLSSLEFVTFLILNLKKEEWGRQSRPSSPFFWEGRRSSSIWLFLQLLLVWHFFFPFHSEMSFLNSLIWSSNYFAFNFSAFDLTFNNLACQPPFLFLQNAESAVREPKGVMTSSHNIT